MTSRPSIPLAFLCAGILAVLGLIAYGTYAKSDFLANYLGNDFPRTALWLDRSDAQLAMAIGFSHFGNPGFDLATAEQAFRTALHIDPNISYAHYELGRVLFIKGEFSESLEEINAELSADPGFARPLYMRGLIYFYRNDLAKAERDFAQFIGKAPEEWAGYNDLSTTLIIDGKYAEAENWLTKAFENVPKADQNPWLWNTLGLAQLNEAKYTTAAQSFSHAKQLAQALTEAEWRAAYPGDDPAALENGLMQFRTSIDANLRNAQEGTAGV